MIRLFMSMSVGLFVGVGVLWADKMPGGRELAALAFQTVDEDGSGDISLSEMLLYRELVFVSMDANEDERVSFDEFSLWDFGFISIADDMGKVQGFDTAQKVVFDFWDRDNDGFLLPLEHQNVIVSNFLYADLNGNGALSKQEFLAGFIVNIAYRSALRPE